MNEVEILKKNIGYEHVSIKMNTDDSILKIFKNEQQANNVEDFNFNCNEKIISILHVSFQRIK